MTTSKTHSIPDAETDSFASDDETQSHSSHAGVDDMADSWIPVDSESTGSSLHDSVIADLLSESSGDDEGQEGWAMSSESGDSHRSSDLIDRDLSDRVSHPSTPPSPSLAGGSYVDAEAVEELSSSLGTIGTISSSQLRLIMPNPYSLDSSMTASTSGTIGDGLTPGHSVSTLPSIPDLKRHQTQRQNKIRNNGGKVDPDWLQNSTSTSTLWAPVVGGVDYHPQNNSYKLLSSVASDQSSAAPSSDRKVEAVDSKQVSREDKNDPTPTASQIPSEKETNSIVTQLHQAAADALEADEQLDPWISEKETPVEQSLSVSHVQPSATSRPTRRRGPLAVLRSRVLLSNKWSVVVFASVTLALLTKFGPTVFDRHPFQSTQGGNLTVPSNLSQTGRTAWTSISVPPASTTSGASSSGAQVPPYLVAMNALSTFTAAASKDASSSASMSTETKASSSPAGALAMAGAKLKDTFASRFPIAIRDTNFALSIPSKLDILPKKRQDTSSIPSQSDNDKSMQVSEQAETQLDSLASWLSEYTASVQEFVYRRSGLRIFDDFMKEHQQVRQAVDGVVEEYHYMLSSCSDLVHSPYLYEAVDRAIRGAVVSQQILQQALHRAHAAWEGQFKPTMDQARKDLGPRARQALEDASEIVHDRVQALHEQGLASVKQARRGLDRIIREAKHLADTATPDTSGSSFKESAAKVAEAPAAPPPRARAGRQEKSFDSRNVRKKHQRRMYRAEHRSREATANKDDGAKKQTCSKGCKRSRLVDMIHHGALQLVL